MNFFCTERPVQKHSDPVFLVHVICRVNARLFPQGTHQLWLNFQVNDINPLIPIDTYFFGRNLHEEGIPLFSIRMPEDCVIGKLFPRMIRLCFVFFLYVVDKLLAVHVLLLNLESMDIERQSMSVNLNEVPSI
ncbi:hypothetical protein V476_15110 [Pseudomonas syringae KCTC 12500]|nr:hypothetical protein V476_15110 [Pseudomonas syringae KCTC 12500]POR84522.1 hypothetical protein BKM21_17370 [Pseudomonas syringae pv. syringae]